MAANFAKLPEMLRGKPRGTRNCQRPSLARRGGILRRVADRRDAGDQLRDVGFISGMPQRRRFPPPLVHTSSSIPARTDRTEPATVLAPRLRPNLFQS